MKRPIATPNLNQTKVNRKTLSRQKSSLKQIIIHLIHLPKAIFQVVLYNILVVNKEASSSRKTEKKIGPILILVFISCEIIL